MLAAGAEARRARALAALALGVLVLHLWLIGGVAPDSAAPSSPAATPTVQLRTLPAPLAEPSPPPPAAAAPRAEAPRPRPQPRPAARETLPPAAVAAAGGEPEQPFTGQAEPEPEPERDPPLPAPPTEPAASEAAPPRPDGAPAQAVAAAAGEAEAAPPLYATRLPPPATLRYELRRGRLTGSGDLQWRPDAGRYRLRLEGAVVGLNVLTQESTGTVEPHGLVPQRFTDQRARRPMVAANFEREAGRIRFSGPSHELPWQPGVQDRLSWMVQLAAVAQAEPQRLAAGERIVLQVVGARGDGSAWAFTSLGPDSVALFGERVDAVRFVREPRHAHDTRVEVWLDPARHHLPVRATLASGEAETLELRLREMLP